MSCESLAGVVERAQSQRKIRELLERFYKAVLHRRRIRDVLKVTLVSIGLAETVVCSERSRKRVTQLPQKLHCLHRLVKRPLYLVSMQA
jgi:hypothetical protein